MLHVEDQGPHHAIGSDGALLVCVMKKPIDADIGTRLGGVLERQLRQHQGRIAYLHLTTLETGGAADVADVRRHYGALMERFSSATGAIAFVSENEGFAGALVRSSFTAVMALSRGGIAGRAFAAVLPASEWLEQAARDKRVPHLPLPRDIAAMVEAVRALPTSSRPR